MKLSQFMLVKLAEEAQEVGKQALKQFQFGPDATRVDSHHVNGTTNRALLKEEILDFLSVVKWLIENDQLDHFTSEQLDVSYETKMEKIRSYLVKSIRNGEIEIDGINRD